MSDRWRVLDAIRTAAEAHRRSAFSERTSGPWGGEVYLVKSESGRLTTRSVPFSELPAHASHCLELTREVLTRLEALPPSSSRFVIRRAVRGQLRELWETAIPEAEQIATAVIKVLDQVSAGLPLYRLGVLPDAVVGELAGRATPGEAWGLRAVLPLPMAVAGGGRGALERPRPGARGGRPTGPRRDGLGRGAGAL